MKAAWESVHLAAVQLADSSPVKQRLIAAFSNYLAELDSSELPREARAEFDCIRRDLTRVPPMRGESPVVATVRKMSNEEAARNAQRIVRLLAAWSQEATVPQPRSGPVVRWLSAEA